jgi:sRNA-binding protein
MALNKRLRAAADSARDPHVVVRLAGANDGDCTKNLGKLQTGEQPTPAAVRRRERVSTTLAILAEFFEAFRGRTRPFKRGIRDDLVAQAPITEVEAGEALRRHCNSRAYLRSMVEGEDRFDLDGRPSGAVTASEAEYAKFLLRQRDRGRKGFKPKPAPRKPPREQAKPKPARRTETSKPVGGLPAPTAASDRAHAQALRWREQYRSERGKGGA